MGCDTSVGLRRHSQDWSSFGSQTGRFSFALRYVWMWSPCCFPENQKTKIEKKGKRPSTTLDDWQCSCYRLFGSSVRRTGRVPCFVSFVSYSVSIQVGSYTTFCASSKAVSTYPFEHTWWRGNPCLVRASRVYYGECGLASKHWSHIISSRAGSRERALTIAWSCKE